MRFYSLIFCILYYCICFKSTAIKTSCYIKLKNQLAQTQPSLEIFSEDTITLSDISMETIEQFDDTICIQDQKNIQCIGLHPHINLHSINKGEIGFNPHKTSVIHGISGVLLSFIPFKADFNDFFLETTQDIKDFTVENVSHYIDFTNIKTYKKIQLNFPLKQPIMWIQLITDTNNTETLETTNSEDTDELESIFFYSKKNEIPTESATEQNIKYDIACLTPDKYSLLTKQEPKILVTPKRAIPSSQYPFNHSFFMMPGLDKHGNVITSDTGEIAKGAEQFSIYVSEYLAELMTAVGNFRSPELQKTITSDWIEKVSELQTYFDGLSVRFALEIGIGRQLGYFEEDLLERLQTFRKETEKITSHTMSLSIDKKKTPLAVPGHDKEKDAASITTAIDKAIEYWQKLVKKIPEQIKDSPFNAETVVKLQKIKESISKNSDELDKTKNEIFKAFDDLEKLESDYVYTADPDISIDEDLVSTAWIDALNPKLKLERLSAKTFTPKLIGGVTKYQSSSLDMLPAFKYAIQTNIPGIWIGFDNIEHFSNAKHFYRIVFCKRYTRFNATRICKTNFYCRRTSPNKLH